MTGVFIMETPVLAKLSTARLQRLRSNTPPVTRCSGLRRVLKKGLVYPKEGKMR
jgi:hypothetical protein